MFRKLYHETTYKKGEDGAYEILVSLNKYEDIYSDFDPSPFKKRDIQEDFVDYIWDSALDIPIKEDISVVFLMEENIRDLRKENQVLKALNNYFEYILNKKKREYHNEKKKSFRYLIIGILLAIFVYNDVFSGVKVWNKIFSEGIMIGTWVFFWEAFYDIFIECQTVRKEIKLAKRFLKIKYVFKNNK